ncbi:urease subunit beta [Atrimonas thermophila]|uniref:urease subunit beta n=1 Tax=Atrimonas thermophila TaxID=3064161 RepID=UPI00399D3119
MVPGEYLFSQEEIEINAGRKVVRLVVTNTDSRPVQVGSHVHFFEVNRALRFDREKAYGFRLNIPAGTAIRFEPGESKEVELVEIDGQRRVFGLSGLVLGDLDQRRSEAMKIANERGFLA